MLKKAYKLTSLEIKSIFKKNTPIKIIRGVFFDIKYVLFETNKRKNFSFAVILSGKVFKKAVERNKIRRRIFSLLDKYLKEKEIKTEEKLAVLIYPKKDLKTLKFLDLEKELYNAFNKIINK